MKMESAPRAAVDAVPTTSASNEPSSSDAAVVVGLGPGLPEGDPWLSFYGTAQQMGDLDRVARTFRVINIDADPGTEGGNFTDSQLRRLNGQGRNKVLSYLNLGSCERSRTYWTTAPRGLVPCGANRAAWLGAYEGYPDETWMDPSDEAYRRLILDHVAPRLAARGIDGFYLDNLEVVEHDDPSSKAWCSPRCRQGGLDLVRMLRERFPNLVLVMQNATGDVTRLGSTGGISFPRLLDGIVHESVYTPTPDPAAESELLAWQAMHLRSQGGALLFVGVEEYVGKCSNAVAAQRVYATSRARGFLPYASDASNSQRVVCYWPF